MSSGRRPGTDDALVAAQRHQRIDARRPARRQVAGDEADSSKQRGRAGEGCGIERRYAEEKDNQHLARRRGEQQTDRGADDGQPDALAHHHGEHVGALGAQCHANPDLTRPPRDRIRGDAIDPDRGQQSADQAEAPGHRHDQPLWRLTERG